eukprot:Nk52_evm66s554 gene=Nk52_evmTU66s554
MSKKEENVKVVVRCRPLGEKEVGQGYNVVVDVDENRGVIEIRNPKDNAAAPKPFTFDSVYGMSSKQIDIYNETARPIVDGVIEGFNGTIFAYGQTGTGKTFTMEGVRKDPELRGLIPNAFEHIYTSIARSQDKQFLVRASYLEIYQEEIRDLLSKDQKKKLSLKEKPDVGVYVKDLSSFVVRNSKEINQVMSVGNKNRSVGATNMNEHSSRSHAIFVINVECSEVGLDGDNHIRAGKLNLVDLAGSERQAKTGSVGERLKEATKINLSLSALGNVIHALVDGNSTHIPYRDSKLTRLLQDSLGGNAKTVMIANIGPANYNYDETVTTLRYAYRAKEIKNKPHINEDPKDALLREFQEEIERLKKQLQEKGGGSKGKKRRGRKGSNGEHMEDEEEDEDEDGEVEEISQYSEDRLKEEEEKLEQEKIALKQDKDMIEEEKQRIAEQLKSREALLQAEEEARNSAASKIKAMESKLLVGGVNIFDRTSAQEKELEGKRKELEERKRKERELQQKLNEHQEEAYILEGDYANLQEEIDVKTKKLSKLMTKLKNATAEIDDLAEEFRSEKEELIETQHELVRDLKLKLMIIENFIPPEEVARVEARAAYDEERETWFLPSQGPQGPEITRVKRPQSACGDRRPISEYAKMSASMGDQNPRFKAENIINIELDMPDRTTLDYEGPSIAPRVQAALDAALADEEDLYLEANNGGASARGSRAKSAKGGRPSSSARRRSSSKLVEKDPSEAQYPVSRNLVKESKHFA